MSPDSLIFQSTLSVRRATRHLALAPLVLRISIHALRKESDREGPSDALALAISIHALRKESDDLVGGGSGRDVISIHALRKESDAPGRSCRDSP